MSVWHYPRVIHWRTNARNGMTPSAYLWRQLVDAENHITAFRHRDLYHAGIERGTDTSGTTAMAGYFRFRAGYGVSRVNVVIEMGLTTAAAGAGAAAQPYVTVAAQVAGGGATTTLDRFSGGVRTAGVGTIYDAPDEPSILMGSFAVTAGTAYEVSYLPSNFARCLSILFYEEGTTTIDEATSFMNTHSPVGGGPIYDADRQRLVEGLSKQYRANGGISAHWGKWDAAAATRSSATYASIVDGTTGTPTAGTSNGIYLDPRYHRTASRTTVPFEWGVSASMSAGTGNVRIIDTAGTTYGAIAVNSATPQWWTATFSLAESAELFVVPQMAGDGAGTLSVYAVSIIEYEA